MSTADPLGTPRWEAGLADFVAALRWSPSGDAIVATSLAGDAVLLDAGDGSVRAKLPSHPFGALSAAWHPDGGAVAVGGADGLLRIARPDGTEVAAVELGAWVDRLDWRGDGQQLAAAAGRRAHVLAPDGRTLLTTEPLASTVTDVRWSPTKRRLAVGCYGGVSWFEVEHGIRPTKVFGWKGSILTVAPSPDGRWLCIGAQDATVHIWRLWSADELEMNGYPTKVEHLAWHHTSRWMAVGNLGEITIWDFTGKGPGGRRPQQLEAHERSISALATQPGGDLLAAGSRDGTASVWDASGRRAVEVARRAGSGEVAALAWSPAGDRLAVAGADGRIVCYPVG